MVSVNVVTKCTFGKKIHMGSSKLFCNMFHYQFQSCVLNPPDFLVDKKKKKKSERMVHCCTESKGCFDVCVDAMMMV